MKDKSYLLEKFYSKLKRPEPIYLFDVIFPKRNPARPRYLMDKIFSPHKDFSKLGESRMAWASFSLTVASYKLNHSSGKIMATPNEEGLFRWAVVFHQINAKKEFQILLETKTLSEVHQYIEYKIPALYKHKNLLPGIFPDQKSEILTMQQNAYLPREDKLLLTM